MVLREAWPILEQLIPLPNRAEVIKLTDEALRTAIEEGLSSLPPNYEEVLKAAAVLTLKDPTDPERWSLLAEVSFFMLPVLDDTLHDQWKQTTLILLQTAMAVDERCCYRKNYFYYGQLSSGKEALRAYERGVEECFKELQRNPAEPSTRENRRHCADFCTEIAMLYMTDLCDEEGAKEIVKEALERAQEVDPENFSVLVHFADYHRVVGELEKAKRECWDAYDLLQPFLKSTKDYKEAEDADEEVRYVETHYPAVRFTTHAELPEYEIQLKLCRTMVDVGLVDGALKLLRFLLLQHEADDRVFHVLALAHMLRKEYDYALECVERAEEIIATSVDEDGTKKEEMNELRNEIVKRRDKRPDNYLPPRW